MSEEKWRCAAVFADSQEKKKDPEYRGIFTTIETRKKGGIRWRRGVSPSFFTMFLRNISAEQFQGAIEALTLVPEVFPQISYGIQT